MTGILPASGVGNFISGSTLGGGQITPSARANRSLRLSGGATRPSASPVVPAGGVPGEPGGWCGEQGAEPGWVAFGACPCAGQTSMEASKIAAKSAAASSHSFLSACIALMRIQRPAKEQVPPATASRNHTAALTLNFVATDHRHFHMWGQLMDARNPNSDSPSPRPVKSTEEARAGIAGQNVRTVLIVGTGAIVVIFGLLWLFYFGR